MTTTPVAFLCHASEDQDPLVRKLATDLRAAGVDVFYSEWEIRAGESLRRKIDEGLGACTHFIAILSPRSIKKPWVQEEMDAGFVKKVSGNCKFIALRYELSVGDLPPLLQGSVAPQIDNYDADLQHLIGEIYEVDRKPPLGSRPPIFPIAAARETGLTPAAERIAEIFVTTSEDGRSGDPDIDFTDVIERTGLTKRQVIDAIDELEEEGLLEPTRVIGPSIFSSVSPTSLLFERLDPLYMGWNPLDDAVTAAAHLINTCPEEGGARGAYELAEELKWAPRRLNPALSVLIDRDLVMASGNMDSTFVSPHLFPTPKTRRWVRERT